MCYTDWAFYKTLTSEKRNMSYFLKKALTQDRLISKKTPPGIIFYVSWYYHKNRNKSFLKHAKYLGSELVVSSRIHNISMLKFKYKYVIENDVKDYNLVKEDIYILDFTQGIKNSFSIKGAKFIFENENNISNLIKLKNLINFIISLEHSK